MKSINTVQITDCITCITRDTPKLRKCLDSITNQTMLPKEVIVGHSEITEQQGRLVTDSYNYPFPVIFSCKQGKAFAAENRNRACVRASCDYISFIDADDQMFSQRLELIWGIINEHTPKCVVHGFSGNHNLFKHTILKIPTDKLVFGEDLHTLKNRFPERDWLHERIHHGHATIHRDVIQCIKQDIRPAFYRKEDSKFVRDILSYYPKQKNTMIFIDVPLSTYIPAASQ